jgi:hypothetical protein
LDNKLIIKSIIIANVLLLIDNPGGHNISLESKKKSTNVKVFYLPANTTPALQLLDQGIIWKFKLYYRKLLVEYLMDLNDNEKNIHLSLSISYN